MTRPRAMCTGWVGGMSVAAIVVAVSAAIHTRAANADSDEIAAPATPFGTEAWVVGVRAAGISVAPGGISVRPGGISGDGPEDGPCRGLPTHGLGTRGPGGHGPRHSLIAVPGAAVKTMQIAVTIVTIDVY